MKLGGLNDLRVALGGADAVTELEAKRRYKNARKRARFWSGVLTFNIHLRSKETRSSRLAEKYELAMCDCKSWEQTIGELTGKQLKHYDPRAEFVARWSKLKFASNDQAKPQPPTTQK